MRFGVLKWRNRKQIPVTEEEVIEAEEREKRNALAREYFGGSQYLTPEEYKHRKNEFRHPFDWGGWIRDWIGPKIVIPIPIVLLIYLGSINSIFWMVLAIAVFVWILKFLTL